MELSARQDEQNEGYGGQCSFVVFLSPNFDERKLVGSCRPIIAAGSVYRAKQHHPEF